MAFAADATGLSREYRNVRPISLVPNPRECLVEMAQLATSDHPNISDRADLADLGRESYQMLAQHYFGTRSPFSSCWTTPLDHF